MGFLESEEVFLFVLEENLEDLDFLEGKKRRVKAGIESGDSVAGIIMSQIMDSVVRFDDEEEVVG